MGQQAQLYSKSSPGHFYSPFNFRVDKMRQLILISFEKNPDKLYHSFELQQSVDGVDNFSYLVIAYRNDDAADVYHQPDYPIASQKELLNDPQFFSRQLGTAQFKIENNQLEASFSFEDKAGRNIEVKVIEQRINKKHPFYLLAPIGERANNPAAFPVYSMYNMSFTKKRGTDILIQIDHVRHKPDIFLLPIDSSKNYFTRYSTDTFNIDWNRNFNGPLEPIKPVDKTTANHMDTKYDLSCNCGHYEVKSMSTANEKHTIKISFEPPFPDIVNLNSGFKIEGRFTIETDQNASIIEGCYHVDKHEGEINLQLHPCKGWQPKNKRFMLKMLFKFVKIFREWPKSYIWYAHIKLDKQNKPSIQSGWVRK